VKYNFDPLHSRFAFFDATLKNWKKIGKETFSVQAATTSQ